MANDISANPWKIDTASNNNIWDGMIWIKKLLWHHPTATDSISVQDKNGIVIWIKYASSGGTGYDFTLEADSVFNGLKVPTMPSGTLYVYLNQTGGKENGE